MKNYLFSFVFMLALMFTPLSILAASDINAKEVAKHCLTKEWDLKAYLQLKESNFAIESVEQREQLALQLMNCLASTNGVLRDDIAYSALSRWLRADQISKESRLSLFTRLLKVLNEEVYDQDNVYQPFAALVLSEVVRVDRISPYLTDEQRQQAVEIVSNYFVSVTDYRGFDAQLGWRHSIAHSADVMLQLALNPKINKAQQDRMLLALQQQINADGHHFYRYGEPKRMAMAVVYLFFREEQSIEAWQNWLDVVTQPSPFKRWGDVYQSQQGLSKLHNTQSFLYAFYAMIKKSQNPKLVQMVPALEQAIKVVN